MVFEGKKSEANRQLHENVINAMGGEHCVLWRHHREGQEKLLEGTRNVEGFIR